jgi:hypothetical protein
LLDVIPLAEVTSVESIKAIDKKDELKSISESAIENAIDFSNAFQINTKQNGYNAGRKYFLRSESEIGLPALISSLRRAAQTAAENAETRSTWQKMQDRVRALYNSDWFQGVATFLIMAVRELSMFYALACAAQIAQQPWPPPPLPP